MANGQMNLADYYRKMSNQKTKQSMAGRMSMATPPSAYDPAVRQQISHTMQLPRLGPEQDWGFQQRPGMGGQLAPGRWDWQSRMYGQPLARQKQYGTDYGPMLGARMGQVRTPTVAPTPQGVAQAATTGQAIPPDVPPEHQELYNYISVLYKTHLGRTPTSYH